MNAFFHIVLIPECIAALLCQLSSLIRLHARGECLYTTGTQNVSAARSFITKVNSPIVFTVSVGKIRPLYLKI